jgi:hypothetical protein
MAYYYHLPVFSTPAAFPNPTSSFVDQQGVRMGGSIGT